MKEFQRFLEIIRCWVGVTRGYSRGYGDGYADALMGKRQIDTVTHVIMD